MYADKITGSIERALTETNRRRKKQQEYNKKNNITPVTIKKSISKAFDGYISDQSVTEKKGKTTKDSILQIPKLEKEMLKAAEDLDTKEFRCIVFDILNAQFLPSFN